MKNNVPNYIINYLTAAQKYHQKSEDNLQKVIDYFECRGIDLSQFKGGCNSNTLEEMICCYVQYNKEDNLEDIIEIMNDTLNRKEER